MSCALLSRVMGRNEQNVWVKENVYNVKSILCIIIGSVAYFQGLLQMYLVLLSTFSPM